MDPRKLVTLTFDKNVGPLDRVFRLFTGAALAASGWLIPIPVWGAVVLSVLGAMWFATGVLSRCSVYYLLGYSTCPVDGKRFAGR
jgi:hypothetical protein